MLVLVQLHALCKTARLTTSRLHRSNTLPCLCFVSLERPGQLVQFYSIYYIFHVVKDDCNNQRFQCYSFDAARAACIKALVFMFIQRNFNDRNWGRASPQIVFFTTSLKLVFLLPSCRRCRRQRRQEGRQYFFHNTVTER